MKVILIDANIYLRFFDSNRKEFKKLLEGLSKIQKDIFITNQIIHEIERNKLDVLKTSIINYKSKIDTILLPEHFDMDSDNNDITKWNKKRKELEKNNLLLSKEMEAIFSKNLEKVSTSSDPVSLKLKTLYKNKIEETEEELLKARNRKERGNPPGKPNDTLGDQITWEQFLNRISAVDEAWIITNDFDYFTEYNNTIYLNPMLHAELLKMNPNVKINCYNTLSDGLSSYFKTSPQKEFIKKKELDIIKREEQTFTGFYTIGKIKSLKDKRQGIGFGFISSNAAPKDLFFSSHGLVGVTFEELRVGDTVSFDIEESKHGFNAVNVQRA